MSFTGKSAVKDANTQSDCPADHGAGPAAHWPAWTDQPLGLLYEDDADGVLRASPWVEIALLAVPDLEDCDHDHEGAGG